MGTNGLTPGVEEVTMFDVVPATGTEGALAPDETSGNPVSGDGALLALRYKTVPIMAPKPTTTIPE